MLPAAVANSADSNPIVVQVGNQSISVAELQKRWLEIPATQRQSLGKTDIERLRVFVDRWIVPRMLLAQSDQKTISKERQDAIEKLVLQQAMTVRIRKQSEINSPVTDTDVKDYFTSHRQDFDRPERLRLFRILVASEADAQALIQRLRGAPDYETWRNLAHDQSLDRATNMRGGELGFVGADGKSDIPELQVDPMLFAAAAHLKDGEIAKAPVREDGKFAVVWRRGHVAASRANLNTLGPTIRAYLREARAAAAFDEFLAGLRSQHAKDLNPNRLDGIEFPETPSEPLQQGAHHADASP
jgi:peptidyl-prolyl cis-trans isomerase C